MIADDHHRWGARGRGRWVEDLVELHVLSEHGDPSATAAAVRWMAGDRSTASTAG
jgi:hypothetical protein